jgi:predicted transcriptional regulator
MAKKPAKAEANDRGTTSVTVRLDNELVAWLDARAEQENRSRANLIETLLKRAKEQPSL